MISCDKHDYVEIACMYNYPIKITLKSGSELEGKALDTQYNDSREECIKIKLNDAEKLVVLESISRIEVLIENPHFHVFSF